MRRRLSRSAIEAIRACDVPVMTEAEKLADIERQRRDFARRKERSPGMRQRIEELDAAKARLKGAA